MPLWNACSAAAHQRLHQKLHPLVCPECGLVCRQHGLNTHVRRACLHYTRQLGYRYVFPTRTKLQAAYRMFSDAGAPVTIYSVIWRMNIIVDVTAQKRLFVFKRFKRSQNVGIKKSLKPLLVLGKPLGHRTLGYVCFYCSNLALL